MTWQEIRQEIYKTVEILMEKRIKKLQYNYCIEGQVQQINKDPRDTTKIKSYNVIINGNIQEPIYSMNDVVYQIGDVVYILIINNNSSNKLILCKKPSVII